VVLDFVQAERQELLNLRRKSGDEISHHISQNRSRTWLKDWRSWSPRQEFWEEDVVWLDNKVFTVTLTRKEEIGFFYQLCLLEENQPYNGGEWVPEHRLALSRMGPRHPKRLH
jgi:hypothetical protein